MIHLRNLYTCAFLTLLLGLAVNVFSSNAVAGVCLITVEREACPGHEALAFKGCNGAKKCNEPTQHFKKISDCIKAAQKECKNRYPQHTKRKNVTAIFNSWPIENGKNFCEPSRPDFNKCQ